jgi:hypothetical protein
MSRSKVINEVNRRGAANGGEYPLNRAGQAGPGAFMGTHRVRFYGSTGLVTGTGMEGVTVGRLSTGCYGISFPTHWEAVSIIPGLQVPTGIDYDVKTQGLSGVGQIVGLSGFAEMVISRGVQSPVVTTSNPSTTVMPHDPVTGTMAELHFLVSQKPIRTF